MCVDRQSLRKQFIFSGDFRRKNSWLDSHCCQSCSSCQFLLPSFFICKMWIFFAKKNLTKLILFTLMFSCLWKRLAVFASKHLDKRKICFKGVFSFTLLCPIWDLNWAIHPVLFDCKCSSLLTCMHVWKGTAKGFFRDVFSQVQKLPKIFVSNLSFDNLVFCTFILTILLVFSHEFENCPIKVLSYLFYAACCYKFMVCNRFCFHILANRLSEWKSWNGELSFSL